MAATLPPLSSSFLSTTLKPQHNQLLLFTNRIHSSTISQKPFSFKVQAAKIPTGVELPKEQPKLEPPFLGFTRTAEIWNSRACMIGLIGTFIVELILNRGILQVIGVDIGKGLDLPLGLLSVGRSGLLLMELITLHFLVQYLLGVTFLMYRSGMCYF